MEQIYDLGRSPIGSRSMICMHATCAHADACDYAALDEIFEPDTVMDWSDAGYGAMSWTDAKVDPLMGGKLFSHTSILTSLSVFGGDRLTADMLSKTANPSRVLEATARSGPIRCMVNMRIGWPVARPTGESYIAHGETPSFQPAGPLSLGCMK